MFCSASTAVAQLVSSGGSPEGAAAATGAIDTRPPTVGVDSGAGVDMPIASGAGAASAGTSPLSRSLPSGATEVLPRRPSLRGGGGAGGAGVRGCGGAGVRGQLRAAGRKQPVAGVKAGGGLRGGRGGGEGGAEGRAGAHRLSSGCMASGIGW